MSTQVLASSGLSSRTMRRVGQSRACTAMLAPAITAPDASRTGAATERSPKASSSSCRAHSSARILVSSPRSSSRVAFALGPALPAKESVPIRAWRYAGRDGRGRELEIVALELEGDEQSPAVLLVIHVMPTRLRGRGPRA